MTQHIEVNRNRIIRINELCYQLSISRATIYRWMSESRFPHQIKLGTSAVGWSSVAISLWLAEREIESTPVTSIH